jgi:hypothetical protein
VAKFGNYLLYRRKKCNLIDLYVTKKNSAVLMLSSACLKLCHCHLCVCGIKGGGIKGGEGRGWGQWIKNEAVDLQHGTDLEGCSQNTKVHHSK